LLWYWRSNYLVSCGLLETKYPNKEIIFVDDGSADSTLLIASKYKEKIRILHKENGGKDTALNYGIVYGKGDIVVVVDVENESSSISKKFQVFSLGKFQVEVLF
jgi:glycosyltransferase involved in cell wall biosynthesis